MNTVFLFSLPRAGSTIIQRMIASHSGICTHAESWLLLPLLYSRRAQGVNAEYEHHRAATAIQDLIGNTENGDEVFASAVRGYAKTIWSEQGGQHKYYLEKTPRYYLIVDEIIEIFKEAKFIFLHRNPLSVLASYKKNWYRNAISLLGASDEISTGIQSLLRASAVCGERALTVRYEDAALDTESTMRTVCDFLELPFESDFLERMKRTRIRGAKGDISAKAPNAVINARSIDAWKTVLDDHLTVRVAERMLGKIGRLRLRQMGYELDELTRSLRTAEGGLGSDVAEVGRMLRDALVWGALKVRP